MPSLHKIESFLTRVEGYLLTFLLSVMVVLAFVQVALRNFLSSGIFWADPLLRQLVLWVGFLGAALATSEARHIRVGVLRKFLSARGRAAVDACTDLFAALICSLLLKASWVFLQSEMADQRTLFAGMPSWPVQTILPLGFGLLLLHFLIRAILHVQAARNKDGGT